MSHPTIRKLAGAGAPQSLDPAKTALLVIDFQNEYFTGALPIPNGKAALENARRLIAHADEAGMPVYHIQHVLPAGMPIFAEDSATSDFHPDAQPGPKHKRIAKQQISAFPGTDLDRELKAAGIETVLVTGLMTHACVAGAARDAVPLGYQVVVAADACATRALDTADGDQVGHDQLHRAALASIDDVFGAVMPTEAILAVPLRA
ncbi:isochorismatase family protein [Paracoccus cavernae]|uniref:Isochorismatase family protein n=1 Tax=Paracoccus cavernae TaxID=1571207 RepID=A0ABT8D4J9_9RHOB|nr:isochorismatase family protein [Paracoccus cavernae]